jgi:glucose/arabinose dehydrogenase
MKHSVFEPSVRIGWLSALLSLVAGCNEEPPELSREPSPELRRSPHPVRAAATVPAGFVDELVASGLSGVTALAFSPDGRLFVTQQNGALRVIKNGALLAAPFLSLSVDSTGERGLLGVAFDPNFATSRFVYVYYTTSSTPIHNRLSRFTANGDVATAGSELVLVDFENLVATNHNGGAIHFGPDGKLYVAVGDNNVGSNAQTLSNRLGKMLRYNADGSIPSDNPFFGSASGGNRAIWARGLRNPFTFSFQPGTGRMFINDVGQNDWEEINDGIAGSNYGWPTTEGPTSDPAFRAPLYAYAHSGPGVTGCAIVGSAFYNPPSFTFPSSFAGKYFFADFCSSWIKTYDPATGTVADFASGAGTPVDLAIGPDGALYYSSRSDGSVRRVRSTTPPLTARVPALPPSSRWLLIGALCLLGAASARKFGQSRACRHPAGHARTL